MNNKETELVTSDFIKRKDTYNIILGGIEGLENYSKQTVCVWSDTLKKYHRIPINIYIKHFLLDNVPFMI